MGRPFVLTTVLAALALGGCGGSNKQSSAGGRAGGRAGSASLSTRNISGLGTVLVNGQGLTLYAFAPDKGKMVTCTGQCASVWPPLN